MTKSMSKRRISEASHVKLEKLERRRERMKWFYDKENNSYCGRTPKSWFLILLYAVVYLAIFTSVTLGAIYGTIKLMDRDKSYKPPIFLSDNKKR